MSMRSAVRSNGEMSFTAPHWVHVLFERASFSWIWLLVRVYVGYQWVQAGWHKITGGGWIDGGGALKGFWTNVVKVPATGHPAITYDWYRAFLNFLLQINAYTWFGPLVAFGELIVGIALILGLLTGFAAFFGGFMNMNFMLAGSSSSNPVLFMFAVFLVMAWKVAGYWGVDRWLLPLVGTPWKPDSEAKPSLSGTRA